MRITHLAAVAAILALVTTGPAAAAGWQVEANVTEAYETTGVELGLGYRFTANGFSLTPAVGALLYHGENSRYRSETFDNGDTVCRDTTNGQFADDADCNNIAADAYGRLEASYRYKQVEFGVGGRFADETAVYGAISAFVSDRMAVKLNAGSDYVALGMNFGF